MSLKNSEVPPSIDHGGRTEKRSDLSLTQEQIWAFEQITPGTAVYNLPWALHFKGHLDVSVLERSLMDLVQRHEVLRASFREIEGRPVQIVGVVSSVIFSRIDVPEGNGTDRLESVKRACEVESRVPFDLVQGPPVRFTLFRLSPAEHVLLSAVHHIVFDGWSIGIFLQELAAVYDASLKEQPFPLSPLSIQYSDFAHAQRHRLQGKVLENHVSFWRRKLRGSPRRLALPIDHPRLSTRNHRGTRYPIVLGDELTASLKALGRGEGPTLFITLLAALVSLLYRYTRDEDIVVAAAVNGRLQACTRTLIGFFANILVLRADVSGEPTFRELLDRVFRTSFEAFYHHEFPFQSVVRELKPDRISSNTPLFQVMLVLQDSLFPSVEMSGLSVEFLDIHTGTAKFDLTLELQERKGRLVGWFEYDNQLFEAETIARMAGHFQTLLEGAVKDPNRRVFELPLLTDAERHRQLIEFNATARPVPEATLPQLFEAQAARTPEAVAVICEGRELSYGELNARANQLAHHLVGLGVGPECLVGICLERSFDMVVGILAILKAGGAYVPLDPEYPQNRLSFVLSDTQAPVLLTQQSLSSRLMEHEARTVCLDRDWDVIAHESPEDLAAEIGPDNLAYVMYTSGSTGRPKGIAVPQRAVTCLVLNTDYVTLGAGDRIAQAANTSFDAATFEIWGTLLNGGVLVILPRETILSPVAFAAALKDQRIDTLFLTTALFNQIARETPYSFSGLRDLLFGGEVVAPSWVKQVLNHGAPARLLHVYGPTESTTFSTWHQVRTVEEGAGTVPIGHPIANTTCYVLDHWLNPVPCGVSGELYIGGAGLARGYWNRPGLTAEKFVRDPFSQEPGARLYRTGDRVRWRPDGALEFLGRLDDQMKIRGHRIEPGEIEAALGAHPAVREAVVVAREAVPGDRRLVAYLVTGGAPVPAVGELRHFLKATLPEYMVPAAFVVLEALPLTPNGKLDRKALTATDDAGLAPRGTYMAPRSPTEVEMAAIWAEVLQVPRVGIHDNFFDLGGHSLMAIKLFSLIREHFQRDLPLSSLFLRPTIAQFTELVEPLPDGEAAKSSWNPIRVWWTRFEQKLNHYMNV
jgi:amino acid adenylation domain-containing protein